MRKILLFLIFAFPVLLFAQYPGTGNKMRLGWQTTGDGLVYRDAGAPSYTPNSRNNAYMYLDTVAQRLYRYSGGAWRDVSDEKYMRVQDVSVLASDVKDSLTIYDRLFVGMELSSAVGGNRGVQLPVTLLDSTYAGRVVRVSALDSSATYNAFVSSSSPDGLLVDGALATSYDLESDETVEFQLYVFDTIYQWRLISSTAGGDVTLPDSLIYGKGAANWIAKFSPNDSTIVDANIRDDGTNITYALPEVAYGIDDTSTPDAGTYGYNGATGRFAYYNAGWRNLISGNVTQNYLMRADANGNAVNAGIVDDGTFLQLDRMAAFKEYTDATLPVLAKNRFVWNNTLNGAYGYNGTRGFYVAESTAPTFTSSSVLFTDTNGQITQDNAGMNYNSATKTMTLGRSIPSPSRYGLILRNGMLLDGTNESTRIRIGNQYFYNDNGRMTIDIGGGYGKGLYIKRRGVDAFVFSESGPSIRVLGNGFITSNGGYRFNDVRGSRIYSNNNEITFAHSGHHPLTGFRFLQAASTDTYFVIKNTSNLIWARHLKIGGTENAATDLLHVEGDMRLISGFKDKDGDLGTNGQLLSSTGTATDWIDAPTETCVITRTIYDADNPLPDSATSVAGVFNQGFWRVPESLDGATMTKASFGIFDKGDLATTGAAYVLSVWYCDGDNANCLNSTSVSFTPSSERELELSGLSITLTANDIFRVAYTAPFGCTGGCGDENVNGLVVTYTIEN